MITITKHELDGEVEYTVRVPHQVVQLLDQQSFLRLAETNQNTPLGILEGLVLLARLDQEFERHPKRMLKTPSGKRKAQRVLAAG